MTTRIQRSRRKGWRLPAGAVCVSRPSIWGNPFRVDEMGQQSAVDAYRHWLMFDDAGRKIAERARTELCGKVLACWCPLTKACHADVLIEAAEGRLTIEKEDDDGSKL